MQQSLQLQEQVEADIHEQLNILMECQEVHKNMLDKKCEDLKLLEGELKDQQGRAEEKEKKLREAEAQISSVEKQKAELHNAAEEMKKEAEVLFVMLSYIVLLYLFTSYLRVHKFILFIPNQVVFTN